MILDTLISFPAEVFRVTFVWSSVVSNSFPKACLSYDDRPTMRKKRQFCRIEHNNYPTQQRLSHTYTKAAVYCNHFVLKSFIQIHLSHLQPLVIIYMYNVYVAVERQVV